MMWLCDWSRLQARLPNDLERVLNQCGCRQVGAQLSGCCSAGGDRQESQTVKCASPPKDRKTHRLQACSFKGISWHCFPGDVWVRLSLKLFPPTPKKKRNKKTKSKIILSSCYLCGGKKRSGKYTTTIAFYLSITPNIESSPG